MSAALGELVRAAPKLARPEIAECRLADHLAQDDAASLRAAVAHAEVRDLLLGIADHSPFLWSVAAEDPARLARLLAAPPSQSLDLLLNAVASRRDEDEATLMRALRQAKRESALLVALADIGDVWSLDEATRALSDFADAAVGAALRFLLRQSAQSGALDLAADAPEPGCGFVVLALGKLGARELNYSSDIDLIVLFDSQASAIPKGAEPGPIFVRLARSLARLLQERTEDGYVQRVDLRLRPDPGSTAIALSTASAHSYYEAHGQNWERAAMIKARPIAGDIAIGEEFLARLTPFVWRKYFDYAAIADIHAMKRQIHAVRGHEEVTVAGHDLKLGRGGIREIEFFAQTQQLIFGGRRPRMRVARTVDALAELRDDEWISAEAAAELSRAYRYLRRIEHRLQMVADEQTQRLPAEPETLSRFALFCGAPSVEAFEAEMTSELRAVEKHYARLFENAPALGASVGNLVFTGVVDDPATLETLARMGFREPEQAAETIRGWHFGRRPAIQSARAREVLTELTPALLEAFAGSGDPDAALKTLDAALGRMAAAVELFSILRGNARLRELFADILGSAPRLADVVAMRPHVLDAVVDPDRALLIDEARDEAAFARRVRRILASAPTFESALDRARDFAAEERFAIGARLLSGALEPEIAGRAYSALAAAMIDGLLEETLRSFVSEHGAVPGGRIAVLAMGKLGSREMTGASDLDLIVIYDFEAEDRESDGPRPLSPTRYYARLTQRLIAALTAPTKAGRLYDVDMRLRPSGRQGPLATRLASFVAYQAQGAETWEHMALTRARVVAGDAGLRATIEAAISAALAAPRDRDTLIADISEMRALVAREKGESDPWDLKLVAGGLLDIEFLGQYLALAHPAGLLAPGAAPAAIIHEAGARGLIGAEETEILTGAHRLFADTTQLMRLTIEGKFDPAETGEGVKRRLAASAGLPDFAALAREIAEARPRVRAVFRKTFAARGAA